MLALTIFYHPRHHGEYKVDEILFYFLKSIL